MAKWGQKKFCSMIIIILTIFLTISIVIHQTWGMWQASVGCAKSDTRPGSSLVLFRKWRGFVRQGLRQNSLVQCSEERILKNFKRLKSTTCLCQPHFLCRFHRFPSVNKQRFRLFDWNSAAVEKYWRVAIVCFVASVKFVRERLVLPRCLDEMQVTVFQTQRREFSANR